MRRFQKPPEGTLFRRSEWFRLVSMIFMLVILFLMIQRARDANVWRWFANDNGDAPSPGAITAPPESIETGGIAFEGPTDLDVDEAEAAQEVFSVIADRTALSADEMPAYLRFVRWSRAQTLQDLKNRARDDVTLAHFIEIPEKYRGQVVRLRLHLRRSLSWEFGPEENSGGAKTAYEAWGWTDESPNFYCTVFTQLPPGMPIGPTVLDEVTFYGYFLKLISYRDQQDKLRVAPLLVGRVERMMSTAPTPPDEGPWTLILIAVGGAMIVMMVVRWSRAYAFPHPKPKPVDKQAARVSVQKWLQKEPPSDEPEWTKYSSDGDDDSQELDDSDTKTR